MKYITLLFLLIILANACVFADPPSGDFPMGVWYEGGVGAARQNSVPEDPQQAAKQYDRDFADMQAHGINCAVVPNSPEPHHIPLLDAAQKHNLKLIIELGLDGGDIGAMVRGKKNLDMERVHQIFQSEVTPIKNHSALWRIQLLDEPPLEGFEHYAKIADALRQFDPDHPPFCCLAGVGRVRKFADITHSPIIAWDFYPIRSDSKPGDQKPLQSLVDASTHANQRAQNDHARTWAVLQCFTQPGVRFPTPAEVRCQTYIALATGSRGIFWFIYGTQFLDPQHKITMAGLTDNDHQQPPDRWQEVGKLTKEIAALVPTLNKLTPVFNSRLVSSNQLARVLKDDQGRYYVFAVNLDTLKPQKLSLRFGTPSEVANDSDVTKLPENKKVPVTHDGAEVVWDQTLDPGDGALFRID